VEDSACPTGPSSAPHALAPGPCVPPIAVPLGVGLWVVEGCAVWSRVWAVVVVVLEMVLRAGGRSDHLPS
jgi:hypothetical protein